MSIENITARILREAQDEADAVKAKANSEKDDLIREAKEQSAKIASDSAAKAEKDAQILKERRHSVAELESRKLRLAAKQEIIDECFKESMVKFASLDPQQYISFIMEQLKPYMDQKGEILLNGKDKASIGSGLSAKLAGTSLSVSDETAQIEGGFILRQGSVSMNASLEKFMENEKKEITAQLADILFS